MHILPLSATEIENRLKKLPEHVADQHYNAESEHPQSGKAVAEAISAGVAGKADDASLHSIAKTGSIDDLMPGVKNIVFDGGDAANLLLNNTPGLYSHGSAYTELTLSWEDIRCIKIADGTLSGTPSTKDSLEGALMLPDDGSVTVLGSYAFDDCVSLTDIKLPSSLTAIGERVFRNCSGLAELKIPNNVTSIGIYAMLNCVNISKLLLGNSLKTISGYAFKGCSSLTSVVLPATLTNIGNYAFSECNNLSTITFEGTIEQWSQVTKGALWNNKTKVTEVVCSDGTIAVAAAIEEE